MKSTHLYPSFVMMRLVLLLTLMASPSFLSAQTGLVRHPLQYADTSYHFSPGDSIKIHRRWQRMTIPAAIQLSDGQQFTGQLMSFNENCLAFWTSESLLVNPLQVDEHAHVFPMTAVKQISFGRYDVDPTINRLPDRWRKATQWTIAGTTFGLATFIAFEGWVPPSLTILPGFLLGGIAGFTLPIRYAKEEENRQWVSLDSGLTKKITRRMRRTAYFGHADWCEQDYEEGNWPTHFEYIGAKALDPVFPGQRLTATFRIPGLYASGDRSTFRNIADQDTSNNSYSSEGMASPFEFQLGWRFHPNFRAKAMVSGGYFFYAGSSVDSVPIPGGSYDYVNKERESYRMHYGVGLDYVFHYIPGFRATKLDISAGASLALLRSEDASYFSYGGTVNNTMIVGTREFRSVRNDFGFCLDADVLWHSAGRVAVGFNVSFDWFPSYSMDPATYDVPNYGQLSFSSTGTRPWGFSTNLVLAYDLF